MFLIKLIILKLQGSLPLTLMFDIPETIENMKNFEQAKMEIEVKHEVTINMRQKPKQNVMFCIIKGHERSVNNIYEARNAILGCEESSFTVHIPETHNIPLYNRSPLSKLGGSVNNNNNNNNSQFMSTFSPYIAPSVCYNPNSFPFTFEEGSSFNTSGNNNLPHHQCQQQQTQRQQQQQTFGSSG